MPATITTTYAITTAESAEEGDFAETGWEDADGITFTDDEDDSATDQAIRWLKRKGAVRASTCPHWSPRTWYSTEAEQDYRTGADKVLSFHLSGFPEDQERAIYGAITGR